MNRFLLLLCLFFLANSCLFSQCYEPTRKDGITFYNKAQYSKAISCFTAAQRCKDKPANHDLNKWIADCNAMLHSPQEDKQSQPKEKEKNTQPKEEAKKPQYKEDAKKPKPSQIEKASDPTNEHPKKEIPICYAPLLKAATVSFSDNNFSDAKELFIEAQKCEDIPVENNLAQWIKTCEDQLSLIDCIKTNYTPFYMKGEEFFKKNDFENAKTNFARASQSKCIPKNSDADSKIDACNNKINEMRLNTSPINTIR